ncbi:MAG: sterol desaturase family protein [Sandaracinaceae bacterium]|nr:sterol desaturase family protein [Sandaracinaceae bacterium]
MDELYETTVGVLLDPDQRVFWPGLLSAAVIAALAGGQLKRYVDPKLWAHPSALLDYQLLLANAGIRILLVAPLGLSAFAVAVGVADALDRWLGIPAAPDWPDALVTAAYSIVLFLVWDLSRYALHRLAHEVPALWEIHKVHHSAEVMTPFTFFRAHPVERFLFGLRGVLATGLVAGVFFHFFRERAVQLEVLGVTAIGFVFNILGSNLRHSHVWLTYGRYVERVFLSPAQHQIHHGAEAVEQRSNYGTWLAIWDWLGGSLRLANDATRPARFGLSEADLNHDPHGLLSSLVGPLVAWTRRPRPPASAEPSKEVE